MERFGSATLGLRVGLLALASLLVAGCGGPFMAPARPATLPDGRPVAYFPNGQRQEAGATVGGRQTGLWTQWYANGQRRAEGTFEDGSRHGPWSYWHENGQLAKAGPYVEGLEHGPWVQWHATGQRAAEGSFHHGSRYGVWTYWDEHGTRRIQLHTDAVGPEQMALIRGLGAADESTRTAAMNELAELGPEAIPVLALGLKESLPEVRAGSAELLGRLGSQADAAAPLLAMLLPDSNVGVRAAVRGALAHGSPAALDAVLLAIRQPDARTRYEAVRTLGGFRDQHPAVVAELARLLNDSDSELIRHTCEALAALKDVGLPTLVTASQSDRPLVRGWAYRSLAVRTPEFTEARQALVGGLRERDETAQAQLLTAVTESDHAMIALLIDRLRKAGNDERQTVSRALGRIASPAVAPVAELLKDPRPEVRYWAAISLGEMGAAARSAVPALQAATNDNDSSVRNYASAALRKIRG